ncbi:MAG: hypothetical protein IPO32_18610 [Crocinitomicaceae bacterium]|nr:hypothetical protein [Crocinitomicaceae bacterium]
MLLVFMLTSLQAEVVSNRGGSGTYFPSLFRSLKVCERDSSCATNPRCPPDFRWFPAIPAGVSRTTLSTCISGNP